MKGKPAEEPLYQQIQHRCLVVSCVLRAMKSGHVDSDRRESVLVFCTAAKRLIDSGDERLQLIERTAGPTHLTEVISVLERLMSRDSWDVEELDAASDAVAEVQKTMQKIDAIVVPARAALEQRAREFALRF